MLDFFLCHHILLFFFFFNCVFTGADLSDYFNYGFNEDTWKAYCEKQKRLRMGLEVSAVSSVTSKITVRNQILLRLFHLVLNLSQYNLLQIAPNFPYLVSNMN